VAITKRPRNRITLLTFFFYRTNRLINGLYTNKSHSSFSWYISRFGRTVKAELQLAAICSSLLPHTPGAIRYYVDRRPQSYFHVHKGIA